MDKEENEIKPEKEEKDKKQKFEESKILKRKLKKIEEEINIFKKEKEGLLKKQYANPKNFPLADYERVGELEKLLTEKENEWLEISGELEK